MTLTLPWPPSVNTYWRHVGPKVLISAAGRSYRTAVADAFLQQSGSVRGLVNCRLELVIEAYPPDRRKRDLDNLLKAPLDALQKCGAIADDGDIDLIEISRRAVVPNGKLNVLIVPVGAWAT